MLKNTLTEALNEALRPLRQKRAELEKNMDYINSVLEDGARRAREIASVTLDQVRKAMNMKI
jgi:tryptophanyl-tRNA synthetase